MIVSVGVRRIELGVNGSGRAGKGMFGGCARQMLMPFHTVVRRRFKNEADHRVRGDCDNMLAAKWTNTSC